MDDDVIRDEVVHPRDGQVIDAVLPGGLDGHDLVPVDVRTRKALEDSVIERDREL